MPLPSQSSGVPSVSSTNGKKSVISSTQNEQVKQQPPVPSEGGGTAENSAKTQPSAGVEDTPQNPTENLTTQTAVTGINGPQQQLNEQPEVAAGQILQPVELTAKEHVQNAITFLNIGEEQRAKLELEEAIILEPDNRTAHKLMRQINLTPDEYFVDTNYFEYIVRPDDTISTISDKFLKDPLKFYILAKYNNLDSPAGVVPGKILKIPGKKNQPLKPESKLNDSIQEKIPASLSKTEEELSLELAKKYYDAGKYQSAIGVLEKYSHGNRINTQVQDLLVISYTKYAHLLTEKAELLEAQTVLEKAISLEPDNKELRGQLNQVKNKRKADRMVQIGLEQYQQGNEEKAFELFNEVLELDPENKLALKQVNSIKADVIETYHKRAMQLYRKQELVRAIELWDEVLALEPEHELAKLYRARAVDLKTKLEKL